MQKILVSLLFIIAISLFAAPAFAQATVSPGIAPDNFLYGLDVFFDDISLALAAGDVEKAKLSLQIAEERLAEAKAMIEQDKLPEAQTAQKEHTRILSVTETSVTQITRTDATEEIEKVVEVERELKQHKKNVETVSDELKIKIKIEGEITAEQQALIDSILASMEGKAGEVEIEIDNVKQETKIKIKQQTGKSDEEIEHELGLLEMEAGVTGFEIKAEIVGQRSEVKIEKEFTTTTTERGAVIDEIIQEFALDRESVDAALEIEVEDEEQEVDEKFRVEVKVDDGISEVKIELKFILGATDREVILDAIVENSKLTKGQVEQVLEFEAEVDEEEELKVKAEIEEGIAKVKVEFAGEDYEFELETTDREAIISEIVERTGLTREQVEAVIEFDEEEEDKVQCPPDPSPTNDNIEVNGTCVINGDVNGNISLDNSIDFLNFNAGNLNGNIQAEPCDQVHVGSGTTVNGNVGAQDCDVFIGATLMDGNVEVEDGDLTIFAGVVIEGNVRHEGTGTCSIDPGATVTGDVEGC